MLEARLTHKEGSTEASVRKRGHYTVGLHAPGAMRTAGG
jgi:hypothetical protein